MQKKMKLTKNSPKFERNATKFNSVLEKLTKLIGIFKNLPWIQQFDIMSKDIYLFLLMVKCLILIFILSCIIETILLHIQWIPFYRFFFSYLYLTYTIKIFLILNFNIIFCYPKRVQWINIWQYIYGSKYEG